MKRKRIAKKSLFHNLKMSWNIFKAWNLILFEADVQNNVAVKEEGYRIIFEQIEKLCLNCYRLEMPVNLKMLCQQIDKSPCSELLYFGVYAIIVCDLTDAIDGYLM